MYKYGLTQDLEIIEIEFETEEEGDFQEFYFFIEGEPKWLFRQEFIAISDSLSQIEFIFESLYGLDRK